MRQQGGGESAEDKGDPWKTISSPSISFQVEVSMATHLLAEMRRLSGASKPSQLIAQNSAGQCAAGAGPGSFALLCSWLTSYQVSF